MSKIIGEKLYKWRKLDEDDFICEIRKFAMRVEQMDENRWWWLLLYNNKPVKSGFVETELKAKRSAIEEYQSYYE